MQLNARWDAGTEWWYENEKEMWHFFLRPHGNNDQDDKNDEGLNDCNSEDAPVYEANASMKTTNKYITETGYTAGMK